jgi:hypothetical protein
MDDKKFFVKDFIQYATPCFGCGEPNDFDIGFREKLDETAPPPTLMNMGTFVPASSPPYFLPQTGQLKPVIKSTHLEIDLSIKYKSKLRLQLLIYYKTNKILTSNNHELSAYLEKRHLFLIGRCSKCQTEIISNDLEFQANKQLISPATIKSEQIVIVDKKQIFVVISNFREQETKASVYKKDDMLKRVKSSSSVNFTLPLLPKYKLRDRAHLINKLNIYTLFS